MFKLEFDTDNDAFADGAHFEEIRRILTGVHIRISAGQESGTVLDVNGNCIGSWSFTVDLEESEE